jgi:hypothetical protein
MRYEVGKTAHHLAAQIASFISEIRGIYSCYDDDCRFKDKFSHCEEGESEVDEDKVLT